VFWPLTGSGSFCYSQDVFFIQQVVAAGAGRSMPGVSGTYLFFFFRYWFCQIGKLPDIDKNYAILNKTGPFCQNC